MPPLKRITEDVVRGIQKNLKEFGYTVEYDYVKAQVDGLARGEQPTDIVAMFARDMLVKNGFLDEA